MPKGYKKDGSKLGFQKGHSYGKRFKKGQMAWNKGKKTGIIPKSAFKKGHNREKAAHWKGGEYQSRGYIYILKPNHPFAIKIGYVKRSRLVMEEYLGRYLTKEEVVHHINGIKNDDRIENLILFPDNNVHTKFHKNPNNVKPREIIFDGRKFKK